MALEQAMKLLKEMRGAYRAGWGSDDTGYCRRAAMIIEGDSFELAEHDKCRCGSGKCIICNGKWRDPL